MTIQYANDVSEPGGIGITWMTSGQLRNQPSKNNSDTSLYNDPLHHGTTKIEMAHSSHRIQHYSPSAHDAHSAHDDTPRVVPTRERHRPQPSHSFVNLANRTEPKLLWSQNHGLQIFESWRRRVCPKAGHEADPNTYVRRSVHWPSRAGQ